MNVTSNHPIVEKQSSHRRVEQTGTPGVVAIAADPARVTGDGGGPVETAADLRNHIAKQLDKATLLVQHELAEIEGSLTSQAATARVLQRVARVHRTIYFMLDAQRLELEALEQDAPISVDRPNGPPANLVDAHGAAVTARESVEQAMAAVDVLQYADVGSTGDRAADRARLALATAWEHIALITDDYLKDAAEVRREHSDAE